MRNFAFPYFSRDIAEFWRRWHISLSTWFRDYVYIPLGGSRVSQAIKLRNTFIIFLASGFWHGANWTFIVWGALNALYFIPLLLSNKNRTHIDIVAQGKTLPSIKDTVNIFTTFSLTTLAWIFFRSASLEDSINYINQIFSFSIFTIPYFRISQNTFLYLIILFLFLLFEWNGREKQFAIQTLGQKWKTPYRYAFYYIIFLSIFYFGGKEQQFIYFQF